VGNFISFPPTVGNITSTTRAEFTVCGNPAQPFGYYSLCVYSTPLNIKQQHTTTYFRGLPRGYHPPEHAACLIPFRGLSRAALCASQPSEYYTSASFTTGWLAKSGLVLPPRSLMRDMGLPATPASRAVCGRLLASGAGLARTVTRCP